MISSHMLSRYSTLALSMALSIRSSLVCSSSFLLRCLHSSSSFVHPFYCFPPRNPWFSCFLVFFHNQIRHGLGTHFLIVSHRKATFSPSHSTSANFFSRVSCTFNRKCNVCRSHLSFPFRKFMIFFNFVKLFPTSKLWSGSVSAPRTAYTSIPFLN